MDHLTESEVRSVLESAPAEHRLWILLAYHHGLRISEVLGLVPEDFHAGHLSCRRLKGSVATLQALVTSDDPLADEPSQLQPLLRQRRAGQRLFPFSRQYAHRVFKRLALQTGVHPRRAKPHALKHSCAVHLLHAGVALDLVQRRLGHRSLRSTACYLRADDQAASTAAQRVFGR
jgi:integrase/recombinase XerD